MIYSGIASIKEDQQRKKVLQKNHATKHQLGHSRSHHDQIISVVADEDDRNHSYNANGDGDGDNSSGNLPQQRQPMARGRALSAGHVTNKQTINQSIMFCFFFKKKTVFIICTMMCMNVHYCMYA